MMEEDDQVRNGVIVRQRGKILGGWEISRATPLRSIGVSHFRPFWCTLRK